MPELIGNSVITRSASIPAYLIAALFSVVLLAICVTIHYAALNQLERLRGALKRHRWLLLVMVHGLILAHIVEIWVFALGYYIAEHWIGLGRILAAEQDWFDYAYYSSMVYTTVGFGDLVPSGAQRLITGAEALAGLSMITWSASFTFLQMQRIWRS